MKVDSLDFGQIEVDADKVIEFPQGILGFENSKRFTFVHNADGPGRVFSMQSVDDASLALPVTTPDVLGINYELTLTDDELALLGQPSAQDLVVGIIVSGGEEGGKVNANLAGPLVINSATRKGMQKVIAQMGCDITLRAL